MLAIEAHELTREFRQYRSRPGLLGAIRDLLRREYTVIRAVDRVNLRIAPGEIVGYIGANGSGKSTTIKMLTGILVPTAGWVRVNGYDPHDGRTALEYKRTIGVVFGQRSGLWWDIAVKETFRLLQRMYEVPEAEFRSYFAELVEALEIGPLLDIPVRKLSLGQRMRCELAAALLHKPRVLFLDEPTVGLDVVVKLRIREFLREVNRRYGTTILLTTHDLSDIEALCPRVVLLHQGRILYDGALADLRRREARGRTLRLSFREPVPPERVQAALAGIPCSVESQGEAECLVHLAEAEAVPAALARLVPHLPLKDLAVAEPTMEEIVRQLYRAGAAGAEAPGAGVPAPAATPEPDRGEGGQG
ncbi:MAG: ATP-binding cassette domain-containing protein [Bacillota bacterium]|nr:MAG: daunorubicin ABC transporter ATP-binding protein [Bacillota bacterium]